MSYQPVESDYFARRGLRRYAGVASLWALGVGAVISGHYSGWNLGLLAGGWGGFAQLMTLLKKERAAAANSIVTTFGGDLLSPSIMSGFHKGAQMIELMNAVGIDVAVPGNHEFDFGPDVFQERVKESKFTWIASNLTRNGRPFDGVADTLLRTYSGVNVGFFGLVTPETARASSPGPSVAFAPWKETAERAIKALQDQGADVIVALTHLDFAEDRELAASVPGISLILGGHDHDPMTMLEGSTLIFKAGADARYLGVIDLFVTKRAGSSTSPPTVDVVKAWRMVPVRGLTPDTETAALVKRYTDQLDAELAVEIGTTAKPLDSRRLVVREGEAAIGDLIADAIRDATGAEVGLVNGGGIRGDRLYPAGTKLTRRDALTELPFNNVTVMIELKGSDLLAALVEFINDKGSHYEYAIGPRLSGAPGKEQLAFIFDRESVELNRAQMYTMQDPENWMRREPLVAQFRVRGPVQDEAFTFTLVNVHVDPQAIIREINILDNVYKAVRDDGLEEDDVILLGNFGVDDRHFGEIADISGMVCVISGQATNTALTAQLDNLVFSERTTTEYTGRHGVFDFRKEFGLSKELALSISDHMPVWAEFSIYEQNAMGRVASERNGSSLDRRLPR